jgi:hypothetical protein
MATRIKVAITDAKTQAAAVTATEEQREYGNVESLLHLLERSVLGRNQNIIRLVESIAYGNMRLALTLFNNFITSGATDILKIIRFYESRGGYTVPFHEFAKSITLGDFQYYRETRSLIANLFEVTRKPNSSHFTAIRILNYLASAPSSQNGGCEFVGLQDLLTEINDAFANEEDAKETILRLIAVDRQLVELDTRRSDTVSGASSIRATSAGVYYLRFLSNAFSYFDLIWHDTPFHDRAIFDTLAGLIRETEMPIRFERVDIFLSYLRSEEEREFADRGMDYATETNWGPFMPRIKRHIENEKNVIRRNLGIQ